MCHHPTPNTGDHAAQAVRHVTLYKEMAIKSVAEGAAYARASAFGVFQLKGSSVAPADYSNADATAAFDNSESSQCARMTKESEPVCTTLSSRSSD